MAFEGRIYRTRSLWSSPLQAALAYDDLPLEQRRELIDGLFSILNQPGRGVERVKITPR